jgi:hypothetical protein
MKKSVLPLAFLGLFSVAGAFMPAALPVEGAAPSSLYKLDFR